MVNGFDKNIEHAARSALYTRYTPNEWHNSCMTSYAESDINRNHSEHLRNDAIRLMRQTDEVTAQGQREAGRRLGERLTDLTFWRNELTIELEKCVAEYSLLSDMKRRTTRALDDLDAPLKIAEECLYFRENRQGIDKVHDIVERSLLNEVQNLKLSQEKLKNCLDQVRFDGMEKRRFFDLRDFQLQINRILSELRGAQHSLEEDIIYKENTIGIDGVCHKLNNYSRGINYYSGIEKYDPTVSTIEMWAEASSARINKLGTCHQPSSYNENKRLLHFFCSTDHNRYEQHRHNYAAQPKH